MGWCMILLVNSGGEDAVAEWRDAFAAHAPHLDVRWIGDPAVAPGDVAYVLVWAPRPGFLASLPNLRLIVSSGAGVDHITADPAWPSHIGIVRMGGDETAQRMGEYVCLGALSMLRNMPRIIAGQRARRWDNFDARRTAAETQVGIMGLGNLGLRSAAMLRALGFPVAGWSRTRKDAPGIECHAGPDELPAFLSRTDILVNLLPDTVETRGVIGTATLARLPTGAAVINAGRGPQLVLPDLLAALDNGHLSGAFLDVFDPEPLDPGSPAWTHPKIIVTPHLAALASRPARARYVADAIATFERGDTPPNLFDPARGY